MLKDIWQMNVCGEMVGHLFLFQWQNLSNFRPAADDKTSLFHDNWPNYICVMFRNIKVKVTEKQPTWSGIICVQALV